MEGEQVDAYNKIYGGPLGTSNLWTSNKALPIYTLLIYTLPIYGLLI